MIALVLVQKPRLMIGDEIGTGIDLSIKRDIYNYLLEIKSSTLENLNCWAKYKSYTATNNIPTILRGKELV